MLPDPASVFESLTEKQHQALSLAAERLTSKQIAQELGVAPVTIDKRIEAVRTRLGSMPRSDLLRIYTKWRSDYCRPIDDLIILGSESKLPSDAGAQPEEAVLTFHDSIAFDARASWERHADWLRPGVSPSDLGVVGKLLFMLAGAVAILMVAVLSIAFAEALMSIMRR